MTSEKQKYLHWYQSWLREHTELFCIIIQSHTCCKTPLSFPFFLPLFSFTPLLLLHTHFLPSSLLRSLHQSLVCHGVKAANPSRVRVRGQRDSEHLSVPLLAFDYSSILYLPSFSIPPSLHPPTCLHPQAPKRTLGSVQPGNACRADHSLNAVCFSDEWSGCVWNYRGGKNKSIYMQKDVMAW